MDKIRFNNVMPHIFASSNNITSEIWGQDIVFERGGLYLIEAASGKGKSTFCSYIAGYRHDYMGNIFFDNEDIVNYKANKWAEIRQHHVSVLFQELRLFPELTAKENVLIKNNLTNHLKLNTIDEWFERMGIPEKKDVPLGIMSFGQQQRVAMMRALAQPFDVLLADEPISHLDDNNSRIIADIMLEEAHKQNACIIVTSIGKHMNLEYDHIVKL